jgi:hypothetical protein
LPVQIEPLMSSVTPGEALAFGDSTMGGRYTPRRVPPSAESPQQRASRPYDPIVCNFIKENWDLDNKNVDTDLNMKKESACTFNNC